MASKKRKKKASGRVVAITGGLGFLGRRLISALEADEGTERVIAIDARHPIELLHREGQGSEAAAVRPKVSVFQVDLTERDTDAELARIFERESVDTVCHLAFLSNPTHNLTIAHELETIGTMYVLHAVEAAGVRRLLSLSSTMCYGAHHDNPAWLTEAHPLRGQHGSRFVTDKLDAEQQVTRFADAHPGVEVAVARLGAMLGGSHTRNFWTRYFTRPVVPTILGYDPLFQFLHAADAVDGLFALALSDVTGVYNLVGRGVLPLSSVIDRLGRRALPLPAGIGHSAVRALWRSQLLEMPPRFLDYLRWPWVADGARLADALGFTPTHDLYGVLDAVREEFA
jgi:UDP-glucose 4-epimerase